MESKSRRLKPYRTPVAIFPQRFNKNTIRDNTRFEREVPPSNDTKLTSYADLRFETIHAMRQSALASTKVHPIGILVTKLSQNLYSPK